MSGIAKIMSGIAKIYKSSGIAKIYKSSGIAKIYKSMSGIAKILKEMRLKEMRSSPKGIRFSDLKETVQNFVST